MAAAGVGGDLSENVELVRVELGAGREVDAAVLANGVLCAVALAEIGRVVK